ncbi:MAG: alkaline phosphatase family protein [Myxococcota bacterium]
MPNGADLAARSALCALALCVSFPARAKPAEDLPRLVLLLAVDQLRADRLGAELPGGLGRLVREGRLYVDAALGHAVTDTCAGHSTMLTGRHPSRTGIPGNDFIGEAGEESVYCVEDAGPDARVFGAEEGRSPLHLRATALGDWMKSARPGTRVFSVSGKDRAAILLGGKRPNAAYWLVRGRHAGFTTSRYYAAALPGWVTAFNEKLFDGLPATWTHEVADGLPAPRVDDFPGESPEYERTSGHPLIDGDRETSADQLYRTPYLDHVTLSFAVELIRNERLGRGPGPDLLALSFSATDTVGHLYGPYSHESRDTLLRLDRELGRFLEWLGHELGSERLRVALSADHGVLPLPEWLARSGRLECPVDGGRAGLRMFVARLLWDLHAELSGVFAWPRQWLTFAGPHIAVRRTVARQVGVPVEQAIALVKARLEEQPAIARAWTAAEIRSGRGELAELYRRSFVPGRSGDLVVQLAPTCLISASDYGTGHGSPYDYDRRVPLVFWGAGVEPAEVSGRAATVDIAPTLAAGLGIEIPADLDGRALFEWPSRPSRALSR